VLQVSLLALTGSLLGVGTGRAGDGVASRVADRDPRHVSLGLTWSAVAQGLLVGLLVSLLFALVPLLDIRTVKPLLLLRGSTRAAVVAWPPAGPAPDGRRAPPGWVRSATG
jgi:putative ABC transport system permease protein